MVTGWIQGCQRGEPLKPMTFDEFMAKMLAAFPDATVHYDADGEITIDTGLRLGDDDTVVPFDDVPASEGGGS